MLIYFQGGDPVVLDIDPDDLWILYKLAKSGLAQVRLRIPHRRSMNLLVDMEYVNAEKTFSRASVPDTVRAPFVHPDTIVPPDSDPRY